MDADRQEKRREFWVDIPVISLLEKALMR